MELRKQRIYMFLAFRRAEMSFRLIRALGRGEFSWRQMDSVRGCSMISALLIITEYNN
jgi:hypothetical protein